MRQAHFGYYNKVLLGALLKRVASKKTITLMIFPKGGDELEGLRRSNTSLMNQRNPQWLAFPDPCV